MVYDADSSAPNSDRLLLPIRRDFWDSIDFYLSIVWVFTAAGWGSCSSLQFLL